MINWCPKEFSNLHYHYKHTVPLHSSRGKLCGTEGSDSEAHSTILNKLCCRLLKRQGQKKVVGNCKTHLSLFFFKTLCFYSNFFRHLLFIYNIIKFSLCNVALRAQKKPMRTTTARHKIQVVETAYKNVCQDFKRDTTSMYSLQICVFWSWRGGLFFLCVLIELQK